MKSHAIEALNGWRKLFPATAAVASLAVLVCLSALVASSIGLAQSQAENTSTPKFEVISVKLNKSPDLSKGLLQFLPGGRFVATNISLNEIIGAAWDLPS